MGCVSSTLLEQGDEFTQLDGSSLSHHIVSLTSTTYGFLTIDPPQPDRSHHHHPVRPPTPPRFGRVSPLPSPLRTEPEVINSWELMAGLDSDSSRFTPTQPPKPSTTLLHTVAELDSRISRPAKASNKENLNPNRPVRPGTEPRPSSVKSNYSLEDFERRCPRDGENRVVLYTTTLRGVRKTFEDCNAVRAVLEGIGVVVSERDVSMHSGYREELRELMMKGDGKMGNCGVVPPRVFVKGRYIGGAEEVLRIHEEGGLCGLVEGLPRARCGVVCEGCGGVGFLPCFECSGSCKIVNGKQGRQVVMRCPGCNENGLVLCPICS